MDIYFIGIALLIFGAFLSFFLKNQTLKLKTISVFSVVSTLLIAYTSIKTFITGTSELTLNFGSVFQNVRFVLDNLSAFFALVISIMSTLAIIYSNGYLKPYIDKNKSVLSHSIFLIMLMASMLGVVVIQNGLMFLIIWELMSLSSFFLVVFEHEKKDVIKAGIKYLVYMHVSVVFIMVAFAILSINAHSFDFNEFQKVLNNNIPLANLVFILAFIGFGTKAGFVPFHNWLPDAHPAAPSHVSGMMSGVMIKTGIYGILRVLLLIGIPSVQIGYFVLLISIISSLYGVLYAIGQHDLKRLLAYHSIENIGIIGMGIGVGMLGLAYDSNIVAILGFAGGILHILNHSIFKELLFLGAGAVYNKTHTRNIEILGGLIKKMPKTATLFLIASIAICGLPPLNGFVSEFFIYFGMLKGLMINDLVALVLAILAIASLALVGTMAILCFTKAFSIVFLGEARSECAKNVDGEVTNSFIFPMVVLAIFITIIGLCPQYCFKFMMNIVSLFTETNITEVNSIVSIAQVISVVALLMIVAIAILFGLKLLIKNKYSKNSTWGCGYNKPTSRMQYSASSYASPFLVMLRPLFKRVVDVKKPKSAFPKEAHYELHLEDIEEEYCLKPILKQIEKFFSQFEKIQNGNIQQYISYGIIFIVIALVIAVILG